MKKFLFIFAALLSLLSFSACVNNEPVEENTTESTTVESGLAGENDSYFYEEYSDHIVLTKLKSKSSTIWLPKTINGKPVTSFGQIFKGSLTLTTIYIPANYTEIEDEAFLECFRLQSVTIEEGNLKSIGSKAFYGCQLLKYASVPASVTDIAEDAFKYCTDLFIYGKTGSAIEEYVSGFHSIYFRDKEEDTTVAETSKPQPEEESSEAVVVEESTDEDTTVEEESTKKPQD